MFGISDIPKFILAFFLVLPVISLLHEIGHVFFAWLMGAKNIRNVIGHGKTVAKVGMFEVRHYYFWYGSCTFENIKQKNKSAYITIFLGGIIFNIIGAITVILLIENNAIPAGIITYQFTYFSMYYVFFALLPMTYPGGYFSDGKIILDLLRNKDNLIKEQTFRLKWDNNTKRWQIRDPEDHLIEDFEKEIKALERITIIAQENRPSKVIRIENKDEIELQNYPKAPL